MDISPQYIAGFFDGDGGTGIYVRKPRPENHHHLPEYFIRAQLSQNNEKFLLQLQTVISGSIRFQPKDSIRYGSCWVLYWSHKKAENFLRFIQPYTILKRPEIDLALQFREAKLGPGNRPKPGYIEKLEQFRLEMKALKTNRNG